MRIATHTTSERLVEVIEDGLNSMTLSIIWKKLRKDNLLPSQISITIWNLNGDTVILGSIGKLISETLYKTMDTLTTRGYLNMVSIPQARLDAIKSPKRDSRYILLKLGKRGTGNQRCGKLSRLRLNFIILLRLCIKVLIIHIIKIKTNKNKKTIKTNKNLKKENPIKIF